MMGQTAPSDAMQYYPLFLSLRGHPVVVIGGGAVAERKIAALLKASAAVTVISPTMTPRLARWEAEERIIALHRPYRSGDLARALLAFAATDHPSVNEAVAREAERKRIPLNRADRDQSASDGFIVPAIFSKGGMTIAVSSGGKSPVLAKQIRDYLKDRLIVEDRFWVDLLFRIKRALIKKKLPLKRRKTILNRLADSEAPTLYRRGRIRAAHDLILKLSGLRQADLALPPAPKQKGTR